MAKQKHDIETNLGEIIVRTNGSGKIESRLLICSSFAHRAKNMTVYESKKEYDVVVSNVLNFRYTHFALPPSNRIN